MEEEGDVLFPVLDTVPGPKESDGDTGAGEGLETLDGDSVEEPSEDAIAPVVPLVVITELMINPETVDDGDGEWIELTNLESEPVDLQGWILRDQGAGGHVFEESFVLNPVKPLFWVPMEMRTPMGVCPWTMCTRMQTSSWPTEPTRSFSRWMDWKWTGFAMRRIRDGRWRQGRVSA